MLGGQKPPVFFLGGWSVGQIAYRVIRSDRRTLAIQILTDGTVLVRSPRRVSEDRIRAFVESKAAWIAKHKKKESAPGEKLTPEALRQLTDRAAQVIGERVNFFAPLVGVTYGRVTIRHQRTRWGSCSGKGNLNFNCLLLLAPEKVLDYVVVHELCHRKELNHSPAFWAEVKRVLPDYGECRKWLKQNGARLIGRL